MPADRFKTSEEANNPMGSGLGIHPGSVVWIRDAKATALPEVHRSVLALVDGVRIGLVDPRTSRLTLSITQERRIALDWLLGFEQLYSDVTSDT